jgi:hypothetical protein
MSEPTRLPKLRVVDYLVLFGAPIVFFLIAFLGLRAIVGPIPKPSPVQRIKDGEIKAGESLDNVTKRLGTPKSVETRDDGSMTLTYTRTVADPELLVEEGIVTIDSTGRVIESHVGRQAPTPTESTTASP